jgi:hypothetical protein
MSTELEDQLRKALPRVDPQEGFAERVFARIDVERAAATARSRRWLPKVFHGVRARVSWPAALAASALLVSVLMYGWHVDRERRGLEARRQLLQALHITGEKLDVAYRGVMRESPPAASGDSGA